MARTRKRKRSRKSRRGRKRKGATGLTRKRVLLAARWLALIALPFLLLVRGAVVAHHLFGAPGWISVAAGSLLCAICLSVWGAWLWQRITGRSRRREIAMLIVLPVVVAFSVYSLGWLAHANAKSDAIEARWTDLHPALRLALGTARLADQSFVVTEIGRTRRTYDRMGLQAPRHSMHYTQSDGWVHAVDLRTLGRSGLRNRAIQAYFEVMGFDTLRHRGTADHLHVSMPNS